MAAIHLTSIMFSKEESDTDSGRNCPKQRKPLVCVWREILTRRRRGLEECWRMTQLVRLAPLAPMHVNCRQSFPVGSSHTASGKKGGVVRALPDSPMGTLGSSSTSTESAQKQVPGPQSSPGVAGEMLQSGGRTGTCLSKTKRWVKVVWLLGCVTRDELGKGGNVLPNKTNLFICADQNSHLVPKQQKIAQASRQDLCHRLITFLV